MPIDADSHRFTTPCIAFGILVHDACRLNTDKATSSSIADSTEQIAAIFMTTQWAALKISVTRYLSWRSSNVANLVVKKLPRAPRTPN